MSLLFANKELRGAYFALAETPSNYVSWEELGDAFFRKQIFNKATSCYRLAIEEYEKLSRAITEDLAIVMKFQSAFEKSSKDIAYNLYLDIATELRKKADPVKLCRETRSLLQEYPSNPYIHHVHGTVCHACASQTQRVAYIEESILSYNKAALIDSSEPSYALILAELHLMELDVEKSGSALKNARVLMDANARARIANQPAEFLEKHYGEISAAQNKAQETIKMSAASLSQSS